MTELLTAAQMRAIEQSVIARGGVTGLELMDRAGKGVVEAIFETWPEMRKGARRAAVLCGPGNNGGDGFVVARLLKEAGWEVETFLYGDPEKLPADARANYERWSMMGVTHDAEPEDVSTGQEDIKVDALFGTGLKRGIMFKPGGIERFYDDTDPFEKSKLVCIDVPSGLDADSGKFIADSDGEDPLKVHADLTVTFHSAKPGHFLDKGPEACGKLVVKDIGLPPARDEMTDFKLGMTRFRRFRDQYGEDEISKTNVTRPNQRERGERSGTQKRYGPASEERNETLENLLSSFDDFSAGWHGMPPPLTYRDTTDPFDASIRLISNADNAVSNLSKTLDHKFSYGHALVLSGPSGQTGAARLAARGALRVGAGLVTLGAASDAMAENAAHLTAIMLREISSAKALSEMLEDRRINALCLGPGMGVTRQTRDMVDAALASGRPIVLDADALSILLFDEADALFGKLHSNCVLTPHGGEFARLFPDIAEKLAATPTKGPAYSKMDAARDAAMRAGCTVLFKGADTVIADWDGNCAIHAAHYDRPAPWLATAGSGDVLAGLIAGLLARGLQPMQAAETAAWLHVECARSFGPGLIAEDLPEELPKVLRDLGV